MADPLRSLTAHQANYRSVIAQLLYGAQRHGLELPALLEQAGIDPGLFKRDALRVDTRQFIMLLRTLTQTLGDEFFGLTERPAKRGTSALLIELMLASSTIGAAIEQAVNFFRVVTDDICLHCEQNGDDIHLAIELRHPDLDPLTFLPDYWLVYLHRLLSWSTGQLIPVRQVNSTAPARRAGDGLLCFLRSDWQPEQASCSLVFSRKYWSLPVVRTRVEWQDHHRRLVQHGVLGWPSGRNQYANQVKTLMTKALGQHQPLPRLQEIADALCMSPQTLHRHLQHEGSGYQQILDDLRRAYATDLLLEQHLSVAEAACYLGFSETRSFSRAFKQWTGQTPSSLRRSRGLAARP